MAMGRVNSTVVKYSRWGSRVELVVEVMQSTASGQFHCDGRTI